MLLTASSCAICGTSTNGLKFGISSSCVLTPAVISKRTESRGSLLAAWPWELGGRLSFWGRVVPTDIIVRLCKLCQLRRRNSITVHVAGLQGQNYKMLDWRILTANGWNNSWITERFWLVPLLKQCGIALILTSVYLLLLLQTMTAVDENDATGICSRGTNELKLALK